MSKPDQQTNSNLNTDQDPTQDFTMQQIPLIPSRVRQLSANLSSIQNRITTAVAASNTNTNTNTQSNTRKTPRLVAVSKLKPASDILSLHTLSPNPHLHFGENYVQELLEKSRLLPPTIKWHFIGSLQSNKAASLARDVRGLWAVESVDSVKKAQLLNKGRAESDTEEKLRVFVQVNTSGEESKSGVEPESDELLEICQEIVGRCEMLTLQGFMTIGAIARSKATGPGRENEDFDALRRCRDWVAGKMGVEDPEELELSMGMSEDFEGAIRQGSDEVRVGSVIFGERPPKAEAKVLEHTEEGKS